MSQTGFTQNSELETQNSRAAQPHPQVWGYQGRQPLASLEKIPKQARSRGLYARAQAQSKNYSAGTCNAGIKPAATSLSGRFGNAPHFMGGLMRALFTA